MQQERIEPYKTTFLMIYNMHITYVINAKKFCITVTCLLICKANYPW